MDGRIGLIVIPSEQLEALRDAPKIIRRMVWRFGVTTIKHDRDIGAEILRRGDRLRRPFWYLRKGEDMSKRREKKRLKIFEKVWRIIQSILFDDGARIGKPDPVRAWIKRELDSDEKVIVSYYRAKMMKAEEASQWLLMMGGQYGGRGLCSVVSPSNLAEQVGDLVKIGFNPAAVLEGGFLKINNLEDLSEELEIHKDNLSKLSDLVNLDDIKDDLQEWDEEDEQPESDEFGPEVRDWTDELIDICCEISDAMDENRIFSNHSGVLADLSSMRRLIRNNIKLNGPEEPE